MKHSQSEISVSVLIPVYGVEKYIERCARSLFEQTMRDGIEFIFVNDCTPDRSMEILVGTLGEYPEREHQVTIINHSENRGIAAARKTGFRASRGEYIIYCDSDDWADPRMYELMYDEAKRTNADIVGCDYIMEQKHSFKVIKQGFNMPPDEQFVSLLSTGNKIKLDVTLWIRMFRRAFYERIESNCPTGIRKHDDIPLTITAHALAETIGYVPLSLYHYNNNNPESLTSTHSNIYVDDICEAYGSLLNFLPTYDKRDAIAALLYKYVYDSTRKLIREKRYFNPDKWRLRYQDMPVDKYVSLKTKVILYLARHKHDYLLKLLATNE